MQRGYASKQRLIAMNQADVEAFSEALATTFPNVRFVKFHYWRKSGYVKQTADDLTVPYFASLADPQEKMFSVWLEPDGWQPRWEGPNREGIYVIANKPRLEFEFLGSIIQPPRYENITEGRICAVYPKGDKEYLRFLGQVWRISEKLTSNILDLVDPQTGEVEIPSRRTMLWVGHHTMEWCRQDPRRRISGTDRPPAQIPVEG